MSANAAAARLPKTIAFSALHASVCDECHRLASSASTMAARIWSGSLADVLLGIQWHRFGGKEIAVEPVPVPEIPGLMIQCSRSEHGWPGVDLVRSEFE